MMHDLFYPQVGNLTSTLGGQSVLTITNVIKLQNTRVFYFYVV